MSEEQTELVPETPISDLDQYHGDRFGMVPEVLFTDTDLTGSERLDHARGIKHSDSSKEGEKITAASQECVDLSPIAGLVEHWI